MSVNWSAPASLSSPWLTSSKWLVKTTDLTELDVAYVDTGDKVAVTFDAIPGETVSGTVTHVALLPGNARGDVVYVSHYRPGCRP